MGMTPEQLAVEMQKLLEDQSDPEANHAAADDLLCYALECCGYSEAVALYGQLEKWYA